MSKFWLVLILPFFLMGCSLENKDKGAEIPAEKKVVEENLKGGDSQLGNPASLNCQAVGGDLLIENNEEGGQMGICVFSDGKECEEWALMRGECPKSGVDTKGLTKEQRHCLIRGGNIIANGNIEICSLVNGKKCPLAEYYKNICPKFD